MSTATRELSDDELAAIDDAAYIEACELTGPNAPGFDSLVERIAERMRGEAEKLIRI